MEEERKVKCGSCSKMITPVLFVMDFNCPCCDTQINSSGQVIAYPYGQGEDYAGERWEDE